MVVFMPFNIFIKKMIKIIDITLATTTVRDYANDAAADGDITLASGGHYTITGSRALYRKP